MIKPIQKVRGGGEYAKPSKKAHAPFFGGGVNGKRKRERNACTLQGAPRERKLGTIRRHKRTFLL